MLRPSVNDVKLLLSLCDDSVNSFIIAHVTDVIFKNIFWLKWWFYTYSGGNSEALRHFTLRGNTFDNIVVKVDMTDRSEGLLDLMCQM